MAVIAVSNPKGGTGKSTTALVLATTLARHGASVTLFDCDPNRNLVAWKDGPSACPVTVIGHADSTNIGRMLKGEGGRSQFVIADLEGTASLMVASAILAADLTLIPMQGSAMDATQARRAIAYIEDQAATVGPRPYRVLFTRTKPGFATRDERVIRETMASAGIPMMVTDLAERAAYRSMFTYRQSLEELDPQAVNGLDKARENADALAGEIVEILRTAREPAHV
ncbi:ParA family protein [Methylobacterium nonmethylotrophicum]|uniref:ParA family protein n=1 Tax=Methylobacterium nonmethylotrophicum TaxID=1141884 RepID=A0A4Z0NFQ6_9HYPH|nr:ParA family protein [Methylobacterium nonmethylotrophicum]TGD94596.1 ParA family protein [Methylobacterium nonmethylotrophicum]